MPWHDHVHALGGSRSCPGMIAFMPREDRGYAPGGSRSCPGRIAFLPREDRLPAPGGSCSCPGRTALMPWTIAIMPLEDAIVRQEDRDRPSEDHDLLLGASRSSPAMIAAMPGEELVPSLERSPFSLRRSRSSLGRSRSSRPVTVILRSITTVLQGHHRDPPRASGRSSPGILALVPGQARDSAPQGPVSWAQSSFAPAATQLPIRARSAGVKAYAGVFGIVPPPVLLRRLAYRRVPSNAPGVMRPACELVMPM